MRFQFLKIAPKVWSFVFSTAFFHAPTIFEKGFGDHSSFRQETLLNTLTSEVLPCCKYILNSATSQNTLKCIFIQSWCKTSRRCLRAVSKIPTNEWCIHQLLWKNKQMTSVQIHTNLCPISYNTRICHTDKNTVHNPGCWSVFPFLVSSFPQAKTKGRNHYTLPWSARQ